MTKSSPFLVGRRENITAEKSLLGADKKHHRTPRGLFARPPSAHRYNTWMIKLIEQEVTSPSLVRVTLSRLCNGWGSFPFYYLNCLRECSIVDFHSPRLPSLSLSNIVLVHTLLSGAFHSLIRLAPRDVSRPFSVLFPAKCGSATKRGTHISRRDAPFCEISTREFCSFTLAA